MEVRSGRGSTLTGISAPLTRQHLPLGTWWQAWSFRSTRRTVFRRNEIPNGILAEAFVIP